MATNEMQQATGLMEGGDPVSVVEATTTAISGLALGAVGVVLGQVDAPDNTPNWLNAAGGLTSLGFAVWYAWWVTTKTIPERDKVHAETIKTLTEDFRNEQKETRAAFKEALSR